MIPSILTFQLGLNFLDSIFFWDMCYDSKTLYMWSKQGLD